MQAIAALLELFPTRAPYFFLLLGVLTSLAALVPFKVNKGGWQISIPKNRQSRLMLFTAGMLISAAGLGALYFVGDPAFNRLRNKHIASYHSLVSIAGSAEDCSNSRCRISYHDTMMLRAPSGEVASYRGRIKTSGRIVSINTSPPLEILNPEQYPANPTFLEFQVSPASPDDQTLEAQGELVIEKTVTATDGKIGWHLPYDTAYVVVVLDLRTLGFPLQGQMNASIETRRSDGRLVTGYHHPRVHFFQDGRVAVLSARDVAADSSIIVSW